MYRKKYMNQKFLKTLVLFLQEWRIMDFGPSGVLEIFKAKAYIGKESSGVIRISVLVVLEFQIKDFLFGRDDFELKLRMRAFIWSNSSF